MPSEPPSLLSLTATGLYVLVAMTCLIAAMRAARAHELQWHKIGWLALGALYFAFAASRGLGLEDSLETALREGLRADGAYAERRDFQRMLIASVLVLTTAIGCAVIYRSVRAVRRRRDLAVGSALGAAAGMIVLIILRVISLHWVDVVLYGPAKLNWVADIGLSLTVLCAACYYVWRLQPGRIRPPANRSRARR